MYVMQVERIERQVAVERQVAAVFLAAGAKDLTLPSLDVELARFDAALAAEPVSQSPTEALLRQLGVA